MSAERRRYERCSFLRGGGCRCFCLIGKRGLRELRSTVFSIRLSVLPVRVYFTPNL